eukprot:2577076-Pleurochrysis_carterae.AAC.1
MVAFVGQSVPESFLEQSPATDASSVAHGQRVCCDQRMLQLILLKVTHFPQSERACPFERVVSAKNLDGMSGSSQLVLGMQEPRSSQQFAPRAVRKGLAADGALRAGSAGASQFGQCCVRKPNCLCWSTALGGGHCMQKMEHAPSAAPAPHQRMLRAREAR